MENGKWRIKCPQYDRLHRKRPYPKVNVKSSREKKERKKRWKNQRH
jgi:hypothetical protein